MWKAADKKETVKEMLAQLGSHVPEIVRTNCWGYVDDTVEVEIDFKRGI